MSQGYEPSHYPHKSSPFLNSITDIGRVFPLPHSGPLNSHRPTPFENLTEFHGKLEPVLEAVLCAYLEKLDRAL